MTSECSYKIFFICLWTFCLCSITSAHAYEFPSYQGLSLNITGNISGNYSNNITFARDYEEKIDQFTAMMILGLGARYEGKRRTLGVAGQFRQPLYNSADIRNSSEILRLDVMNEFSKFDRLRLLNTYTHTKVSGSFEGSYVDEECRKLFIEYGIDAVRDDPRCNNFLDEFGREQGEFDAYRNIFNINFSKDFSDKINIAIGYINEIYDTSNNNLNDSIRNSVNARVNYKLSYATILFLTYSFSEISYDKGIDIATNSVRTGIRQYITKRLYFSGNVGMVFRPSTNSMTVDALLTGELNDKTIVLIDFSRDIRSAIDREDEFRSWRITGRITQTLMEEMDGFISAFYGEGDFVTAAVTDKLFGVSASLNYIFWQHKRGARVSGTSGYTYSILNSTDTSREYDRSSINATLSIAF